MSYLPPDEAKAILLNILIEFTEGGPDRLFEHFDHVGFDVPALDNSKQIPEAWLGHYRIGVRRQRIWHRLGFRIREYLPHHVEFINTRAERPRCKTEFFIRSLKKLCDANQAYSRMAFESGEGRFSILSPKNTKRL